MVHNGLKIKIKLGLEDCWPWLSKCWPRTRKAVLPVYGFQ